MQGPKLKNEQPLDIHISINTWSLILIFFSFEVVALVVCFLTIKKLVKLPSQHEEWPKIKGRRLDPCKTPPHGPGLARPCHLQRESSRWSTVTTTLAR